MSGWLIAMVALAVPTALFAFLLISALVESRLVAPDERADKVRAALDHSWEPDELERFVSGVVEEAMPVHQGRRSPAGAPIAGPVAKP